MDILIIDFDANICKLFLTLYDFLTFPRKLTIFQVRQFIELKNIHF